MAAMIAIPELVALIIDQLEEPADVLTCARINSLWNILALKQLYKGSISDMKWRFPDVESLNSLLVASRDRFDRNMSSADHLLIAPEKGADQPYQSRTRQWQSAFSGYCRAWRSEKDTELLLRPHHERGPSTVAIPFQFPWRYAGAHHALWGLLPHPKVKYLVIDLSYCDFLTCDRKGLQLAPADAMRKLSNLKALAIHEISSPGMASPDPSEVLHYCDLDMFHYEDLSRIGAENKKTDMKQLCRSLVRHRNLKGLALLMHQHEDPIGGFLASEVQSGDNNPWPELKALCLSEANKPLIELIPSFTKLEMLDLGSIRSFSVGGSRDTKTIVNSITKCKKLKFIDIELPRMDSSTLLQIASACPDLRKLRISPGEDFDLCIGGPDWEALAQALPNVVFFSLLVCFCHEFDSSLLEAFAKHCPKLQCLEVTEGSIETDLDTLSTIPQFGNLRQLKFAEIEFRDVATFVVRSNYEQLMEEWQRVFPRLGNNPCDITIDDPFELVEEYDDRREMSDMEECMPLSTALSSKLWNDLGYVNDDDMHSCDKVMHMWQTQMEVETFGWPIIPLEAYIKPGDYSSS
ncbi:MAG: hypothetical protein M1831_006146 [Alyxoria varia]|nr:MAG: hypothetical protein M1831_006146 [Alyxoria varia]